MPRQNNPNNQFVKKPGASSGDRNRMVIEPSEDNPQSPIGPLPAPSGQYSDRIKVSPMDEQGRATGRAVKGWPEGLKKA